MPALMKKPHTDGMVSLTVVVPAARVEAVTMAIEEAIEPNIPANQVFPESRPGKVLRGARGLRERRRCGPAALEKNLAGLFRSRACSKKGSPCRAKESEEA
jgi:hypothetical protein